MTGPPRVKAQCGLNTVKAGVFRRGPATRGLHPKSKPPLLGVVLISRHPDSGAGRRRLRRRRRPVSRRGSRIRALFQMKQEIPFGTGPRRSKWDFLLHLGLSWGGLSHLISTIFEKLLAPARGIAYINNPQADMAQLVEHNLAKVGVAGSSPVVRSIACIGPVFESALFISTAKWPSGKAEACKAFTPGSNPGFASRQHPGAPAPVLFYICGHGSVGRAQPCQGWGRGFEPRCPLHLGV